MDAVDHPFVRRPHRTLIALSLPVLVSLLAEPLTGLVDTFFVARLGSAPLAALGIAVTLLSSLFWIFNFLGIGTQTEVARSQGAGRGERARDRAGLALALAGALGMTVGLLGAPLAEWAVEAMGARGPALEDGAAYLRVRLIGGPAVLAMIAAFGALRGLEDMRTPLWIALSTNVLNAVLDPLLIFGLGPLPRLGLVGAAWASVIAQWLGAGWAVAAVFGRLGAPRRLDWREARGLLIVGRDLFLRTGLLMAFLVAATAAANHLGSDAGAAHQAVRQLWTFTAFGLDAYATAAQSLVGYFHGAARLDLARRVAAVTCGWSLATGVVVGVAMAAATQPVAAAFVPEAARSVFPAAWWVALLAQPVNAIGFATDGLHWGTGDYRFLRNAMFAATGTGLVLLAVSSNRSGLSAEDGLAAIWLATGAWIGVRAALGVLRIWPGIGRSPYAIAESDEGRGTGDRWIA